MNKLFSVCILALVAGCAGAVDGEASMPVIDAGADSGVDASVEVDASVAAPVDECGCTVFESQPSPSAIYIKTCGNNAQYVEPSVGVVREVSVCVLADGGTP